MSQAINRRRALTVVAAVPAVAALSESAIASQGEDVELRRLWTEYLIQVAAINAASLAHRPIRAAYDEEFDALKDAVLADDGNLGRLHEVLWNKHGLERPWRHLNRQWAKLDKIMKAIRRVKAESLFGVGVKLASLPHIHSIEEPDREDAMDDALRAIEALTNETVLRRAA